MALNLPPNRIATGVATASHKSNAFVSVQSTPGVDALPTSPATSGTVVVQEPHDIEEFVARLFIGAAESFTQIVAKHSAQEGAWVAAMPDP
jgi:hypothetical protein